MYLINIKLKLTSEPLYDKWQLVYIVIKSMLYYCYKKFKVKWVNYKK